VAAQPLSKWLETNTRLRANAYAIVQILFIAVMMSASATWLIVTNNVNNAR